MKTSNLRSLTISDNQISESCSLIWLSQSTSSFTWEENSYETYLYNIWHSCDTTHETCTSHINVTWMYGWMDNQLTQCHHWYLSCRSVGGLRISLYNAITLEEAQVLVQFMKEFQQKNNLWKFYENYNKWLALKCKCLPQLNDNYVHMVQS